MAGARRADLFLRNVGVAEFLALGQRVDGSAVVAMTATGGSFSIWVDTSRVIATSTPRCTSMLSSQAAVSPSQGESSTAWRASHHCRIREMRSLKLPPLAHVRDWFPASSGRVRIFVGDADRRDPTSSCPDWPQRATAAGRRRGPLKSARTAPMTLVRGRVSRFIARNAAGDVFRRPTKIAQQFVDLAGQPPDLD